MSFAPPSFFSASTSSVSGRDTKAVTAADFDRNGTLDLAMANRSTDNVTVLLGKGSGGFENFGGTFPVGIAPTAVAAGDFGDFSRASADGKADLVVVNSNAGHGNGYFNLFIGDGQTGGFTKFTGFNQNISGDFGVGIIPVAAVLADFNGDGALDVAVANHGNGTANPGNITVALRRADGGFNTLSFADPAAAQPDAIASADFNRDGFPDLAVVNLDGSLSIFYGNAGNLPGAFTLAKHLNITIGGQLTAVTAGDFNQDGIPDIVDAGIIGGTGAMTIQFGQPDGVFTNASTFFSAGTSPQSVTAADFNGDGWLDLAVANDDPGSPGAVTVLQGQAGSVFPGQSSFQLPVSFAAGFGPQAVVAGDFNRDGKPDLAVANFQSTANSTSSGGVSLLMNQSASMTTLSATPSPSVAGQSVTLIAIVSAVAPAGGFPTGTVTFADNGIALGPPQPLSNGAASLTTTALPASNRGDRLTAVYSGDNNFSASSQLILTFVDASLSATGVNVTVAHGITATKVTVATFTDADPDGTASAFKANITWGDGTAPSPGTISASGSMFTVAGSHTFPAPGRYLVSVAIQDSGGSTAAATSKAVIGSLNERLVSQAYLDLLQRPVDATGLQVFSAALDAGLPPSQVSQGITSSQEYRSDLIAADYQLFLHRTADLAGLGNFLNFLAAGGTDEQVAVTLTGSAEYFQTRGGSTNDGFLSALFQDALGRPIDAGARTNFNQQLAAGVTRGQVAAAIFGSTEYRQDLVGSFYLRFLRRPADSGGLASFVLALGNGAKDEDVIAALIASAEYLARL